MNNKELHNKDRGALNRLIKIVLNLHVRPTHGTMALTAPPVSLCFLGADPLQRRTRPKRARFPDFFPRFLMVAQQSAPAAYSADRRSPGGNTKYARQIPIERGLVTCSFFSAPGNSDDPLLSRQVFVFGKVRASLKHSLSDNRCERRLLSFG